jgi:hypothetical protein
MKLSTKCISGLTLVSVMVFLIFGGCTQRIIDFTVISSKQMEMRIQDTGKGNRVEGKDGVYWVLFIPLGTPNLKEAVDRAIESAGPGYDALIDGVIYSSSYYFILSGYTGYKVIGTPIKTAQLKAELLREGKDVDLAMKRVLFHSSLGISNEEMIQNIGIVEVDDLNKVRVDNLRN